MPGKEYELPLSEVDEITNMTIGDTPDGLAAVQYYLLRFGHLGIDHKEGMYDEATAAALRDFQHSYGLAPTGDFDSETKNLMQQPRCGMSDIGMSVNFNLECCWEKRQLLFAFDNGTDQIDGDEEFDAVRAAINSWMDVVEVDFIEVGVGESPDVQIGWRVANDPDYDMEGPIIAHADFPPGCSVVSNNLPKPVHFDDTEHTWTIGAEFHAFDIETVALHEIGHILGLGHVLLDWDAVMFPIIASNSTKRELTTDDRLGVLQLYPTVPHVQELTGPIAASLIRAAGLVPKFVGATDDGAWVWRQSPRYGTAVACNSTVTMQMRPPPIP